MNNNSRLQTHNLKLSCHFKQTEGDECFAYHFVNKVECQNCWKRHRFIAEYMPVRQQYKERVKKSEENRQGKIKRFISWGGGIVTKNETIEM